MAPQIIVGTACFGMDMTEFQDSKSVSGFLQAVQHAGVTRLDCGARYPPLKPGRAEELIAESKPLSAAFEVDTKVLTDTKTDGSGDLTAEAIAKSVEGSLKRLDRPAVKVLHIHRADPSTPVAEQVKAFNEQIALGHCQEWGVSNVQPDMLREMLRVCDEQGLRKPACYQGDYNIITRGMETRLLPLLREHGVAFNAFRPLAAGFLTGKAVSDQDSGTRFSKENPLGNAMRRVFGGDDLHAAMKQFDADIRAQGLTSIEVAIRWIAHHSALSSRDGIIMGASKTSQFEETYSKIANGPLPAHVLEMIESLWASVKKTRGQII